MLGQLNMFKNEKSGSDKIVSWQIYVDGASRNNPGPSGAGVYIIKDKKPFLRKGFFLGTKTNNQAEYLALALAAFFVKSEERINNSEKNTNNSQISIISDSELMVKQMKGLYKVKNPELLKIKNLIDSLLKGSPATFKHVLRANNKIADQLANDGIDKKNGIPDKFLSLMKTFDIK